MMISSELSALAWRIGNSQQSRIPSTDHQEFKSACVARSSGQPPKLAVPLTRASIATLETELWGIEPGSGIDSRGSGIDRDCIGRFYRLDVVDLSGSTVVTF